MTILRRKIYDTPTLDSWVNIVCFLSKGVNGMNIKGVGKLDLEQ